MATEAQDALGLIAGNGRFPVLFAKAARERGRRVVAVAMRGETDPAVESEVDAITWVRVGQLGQMIRAFKKAGVREAAMAGGVTKTRLFERARPDLLGWSILAKAAVRKDDGLLRAIAAEFEKRGVRIVESTLYLPDVLAPLGVLTERKPTAREGQDLRYGFHVAREIGKLDIGQTVAVKEGAVVALEAIEGTDACIRRAGKLTRHQGAVIVKVAKPVQDMRFDVPAIGPKTIDSMAQAGARCLGIEAGRTLLLEPERIIAEANARGLCIVGLSHNEEGLP